MPSPRKITFVNDYYYHIFNRGIDRRTTFNNTREYKRALQLLYFLQFNNIPLRYSQYQHAKPKIQEDYMKIMQKSGTRVKIIAYCLMPNHFHLLLKQIQERGIQSFTSNFTNAYTKYFNEKFKRSGSLFEGIFKAVFIETEEQLLHLTRYIHLNPVIGSIVKYDNLQDYQWSSYSGYVGLQDKITDFNSIKKILPKDYKEFVKEQVGYAKELSKPVF